MSVVLGFLVGQLPAHLTRISEGILDGGGKGGRWSLALRVQQSCRNPHTLYSAIEGPYGEHHFLYSYGTVLFSLEVWDSHINSFTFPTSFPDTGREY